MRNDGRSDARAAVTPRWYEMNRPNRGGRLSVESLLLQIAAVLVTGRVLAWLVGRVGQPAVIGEIIAGIVLGPSLLGAVSPGLLEALFPRTSLPLLSAIAQLGLVFYMFTVGLELDGAPLKGRLRAAFVISVAGIAVPFLSGTAAAFLLPRALAGPGARPWVFALFVGVAMSVTAFPVLARILASRGMLRTPVGAMALASAAFGDVVAWLLLAIVAGLASASSVRGAWTALGALAAYGGLVWGVVRPLLERWGRAEPSKAAPVVALLVVLSAWATERIGVHALFGGFLLGLAMPRRGAWIEALPRTLGGFVSFVLLPLFFATSGLRTGLGLLSDPSDWALTGLLLLIATLGKFGGSAWAAGACGFSGLESAELGALMNTRGLMELVVLHVGLELGVISERMFTMMVLVALATTWMTSPLLGWLDARRRSRPARAAVSPLGS